MQDADPGAGTGHPALRVGKGWGTCSLACAIPVDSGYRPAFERADWNAAAAVRVAQDETANPGPLAKLKKVSANAGNNEQIHRLTDSVANLKMIRNSDASLRSSAARLR